MLLHCLIFASFATSSDEVPSLTVSHRLTLDLSTPAQRAESSLREDFVYWPAGIANKWRSYYCEYAETVEF